MHVHVIQVQKNKGDNVATSPSLLQTLLDSQEETVI